MTPQQLWKLAFRTCEAKLRKSGVVFSEAEIMAEFPQLEVTEEEVTEAFERKIEDGKEQRYVLVLWKTIL